MIPQLPPESFEELYEHAPCGYLTSLPDGTLIRCNQTFLELVGYDREALLGGRRLQELLTIPCRIYFDTHLGPLLAMQGFVREVALDLVRADGQRAPVLLHVTLQRDEQGHPVSLRAMVCHASDRRRYERELLEAKRRAERLVRVVEVASDAILTAGPDGTIQTWNGGAESLFGFRADEVIGRQARELLVPADRRQEHDEHLARLRAGQEVHLDTVRMHKRGHPLDVSIRSTPHVEAFGEVAAFSSIIRDISGPRRLEEQTRRAEQLQVAGTLAGGVAHEVNNQMTVVLGFGDQLARSLGPDDPRAAAVQHMLEAGTRAARISQQLLAFGRRQRLAPRPVDVHALVGDLVPVLLGLLGADKSLVLGARAGRLVAEVDAGQIEQVLVNLVANARDAMSAGARAEISVQDVVLTEADAAARPRDDIVPGPYVLLRVSDTGHGMDRATLARAFDPFFTTRPLGAGTGLGLSTVHGIAKQLGGQVWAESAPGRGTTVSVYLPAAAAAPSQPEPAPAARSVARGAVLVVEDDEMVRTLSRHILEDAGLQVTEASNGRRALQQLERSSPPPEVVLTDIIMPEMNGRQLGNEIRTRWPEIRVLYMSGYSAPDMQARDMLYQGEAFLQKPFRPAQLIARVQALLEQPLAAPAPPSAVPPR